MARSCPVLVETWQGRTQSGLSAPKHSQPAEVALALREKGWTPYRVRFDSEGEQWIANVIDWKRTAA
jgi:hypothetical protein